MRSLKLKKLFLLLTTLHLFGTHCHAQATTDSLPAAVKDSLIKVLIVIDQDDQKYRNQMEMVQATYGGDSKEMLQLEQNMKDADSVDLVKVEAIVSKFGWLGADVIGDQGNSTLFMVIQHADLQPQEKYLPIIRDAVAHNKAKASDLALLEDRVALLEGKEQIYGSQLTWNMKTNTFIVAPLSDPDNVDKRRADVGLPPMSVYLGEFDLTWDVEKYKVELPALEVVFFRKGK
jgi:hypothetical protein